jgi:uncharacterized protein (DUF1330 family)
MDTFILPTPDQYKQLMNLPHAGPVVMVNLLKFNPEGGKESYAKYAEASWPCLKAVGGKLLYRGRYRMAVIGDDDWDEILLVEYPSAGAFMTMMRDKTYQAIVHYRTEALADSRLWATTTED